METVIQVQEKQDYALEVRDSQGNWHLRYFTPSKVATFQRRADFNRFFRIPKPPEPVVSNEPVSRTVKPVKSTPENA